MSALKSFAYLIGLPLILVTLWWAATVGGTSFFVPTPGQLIETFVEVWFGPRFWEDVLPSLGRLFTGLFWAIVLGVIIGVIIGSFRTIRQLLEPLLEFFRAIPFFLIWPLLMIII